MKKLSVFLILTLSLFKLCFSAEVELKHDLDVNDKNLSNVSSMTFTEGFKLADGYGSLWRMDIAAIENFSGIEVSTDLLIAEDCDLYFPGYDDIRGVHYIESGFPGAHTVLDISQSFSVRPHGIGSADEIRFEDGDVIFNSQDLDMSNNRIHGLLSPSADDYATNKLYVDNAIATAVENATATIDADTLGGHTSDFYQIAFDTTALATTDDVATATSAITGDNLGNHTATQNLAMGTHSITCTDNEVNISSNAYIDGYVAVTGNLLMSDDKYIGIEDNERIVFDTVGDIVIKDANLGINIDNPSGTLDIAKSNSNNRVYIKTYQDTATGSELYFVQSNTDTIGANVICDVNDHLGYIYFYGVDASSTPDQACHIFVKQDGNVGDKIPGRFVVETYSANAINTNALVVDSNGDVGIGVEPVGDELEVNGVGVFGNGGEAAGAIRIGEATNGMNSISAILLQNRESSNVVMVTGGGKVGIGVNPPDEKLHVYNGDSGATSIDTKTDMVLEDDGDVALTMLCPGDGSNESAFIFARDKDNANSGVLGYNHINDYWVISSSATVSMYIAKKKVGVNINPTSTFEVSGGGMKPYSRTEAQLKAWAPAQEGEIFWDSTNKIHVSSTGTLAGQFALIGTANTTPTGW